MGRSRPALFLHVILSDLGIAHRCRIFQPHLGPGDNTIVHVFNKIGSDGKIVLAISRKLIGFFACDV